MGLAIEFGPPVAVPHIERALSGTGPARAAAVEPLRRHVLRGRDVGHREMRHVKVTNRPSGGVRRRRVDADSKEGHLIPKAAAVRRLQVAGVVPPLDPILGVAAMVTGKLQDVAGCGQTPAIRSHRAGGLGGEPRNEPAHEQGANGGPHGPRSATKHHEQAAHRAPVSAKPVATRAGYRPATAVATATSTVERTRNQIGRSNCMVHPKLWTLIT